jgi:molecular chaperone GrpE
MSERDQQGGGGDPPAVEIDAEVPPEATPIPTIDAVTAPQAGAAPLSARIDELGKKLEQLEKDKKETYDRLLRTAADFDNFKKRSRRESQEAEDRGRQSLLKELLPAIDNLERAVAHAGNESGAVVEGLRLVLKQLTAALEKFGVRAFESAGKAFDPQLHEAVQQLETDEHPAGTVVSEFQKGYLMGERLLRPAMVLVAKPKSSDAASHGNGAAPPDPGPNGPTDPGGI